MEPYHWEKFATETQSTFVNGNLMALTKYALWLVYQIDYCMHISISLPANIGNPAF